MLSYGEVNIHEKISAALQNASVRTLDHHVFEPLTRPGGHPRGAKVILLSVNNAQIHALSFHVDF
jgi:hypothetical protein